MTQQQQPGTLLDERTDLRLDEGPLGPEEAEVRLRAWWSAR